MAQRPAHWDSLTGEAWFHAVEKRMDHSRAQIETLQKRVDLVEVENHQLREQNANLLDLVKKMDELGERVDNLSAAVSSASTASTAGGGPAGGSGGAGAVQQEELEQFRRRWREQPPPPPSPQSRTAAAAEQPQPPPPESPPPTLAAAEQPPQLALTQEGWFGASHCPRCRQDGAYCPRAGDRYALKRWHYDRDYAAVTWKENPRGTLKTLFGYDEIEYNWDRLQLQGHALLDASLFLNCDGGYRGDVMQALDMAVIDNKVEMVLHRTNSKAYTCLGLMCTTCRYCIALEIGNPNSMSFETLSAMRASLARWLGVEIPEVERFVR